LGAIDAALIAQLTFDQLDALSEAQVAELTAYDTNLSAEQKGFLMDKYPGSTTLTLT
jgi:hypothetical protein